MLGNITREIELRYTPSGMAVCDIGLAVSEKRKSGEETLFIDCTVWDKTAELAAEYLAKGRQVLFEGRLKLDQWNDKESGAKRSKISMTVDKMVFIGGGKNEAKEPQLTPQLTPQQQEQMDTRIEEDPIIDDDVPF